jgi:hypothetical protein
MKKSSWKVKTTKDKKMKLGFPLPARPVRRALERACPEFISGD